MEEQYSFGSQWEPAHSNRNPPSQEPVDCFTTKPHDTETFKAGHAPTSATGYAHSDLALSSDLGITNTQNRASRSTFKKNYYQNGAAGNSGSAGAPPGGQLNQV